MGLLYHPEPGEIVMCRYEDVVISPEMRKARPVVIVGPRLRRRGRLATIIPLSTTAPQMIENYHCRIELSEALPPPFDNIAMWAKCDMITTVSLDRLDRFKGSRTSGGAARKWLTGRVSSEQLQDIRTAMLFGLGLDSLTNRV